MTGMEDMAIARALHVIGVLLWIGGVAFVTTVLLPAARALPDPARRIEWFEQAERRFAGQARITTLLAGATGFWMLHGLDLGWRFAEPRYWWMHAMVAIWVLFTAMLFVLEPLVLHRWFRSRAARAPEQTFRLIERMHRVLLGASLATVAGAVAGSHGLMAGS